MKVHNQTDKLLNHSLKPGVLTQVYYVYNLAGCILCSAEGSS